MEDRSYVLIKRLPLEIQEIIRRRLVEVGLKEKEEKIMGEKRIIDYKEYINWDLINFIINTNKLSSSNDTDTNTEANVKTTTKKDEVDYIDAEFYEVVDA